MRRLQRSAFLALMFLAMTAGSGWAQASRTWVSGVGDDANSCSRTAPCKTFAGAISKTAAHGEISVLDPGGFGAVTITKSISIVAQGIEGSVLVSGTNGITISAQPSDVVALRGLTIEGLGMSPSGVSVQSATDVQIENCVIHGFAVGLTVSSNAYMRVHVLHSSIYQNTTGIKLQPTGSSLNGVVLDSSSIDFSSGTGIVLAGQSPALLLSDSSVLSSVSGIGIDASGASGAVIQSYGNNRVTQMVPAFTAVPLK